MTRPADIARDSRRPFLESHPWIRFEVDLQRVPWRFWEQLGEARSKCRHIATTPLPPAVSQNLSALYLAKGALATTAIEGNTLTEEQALEAVQGQLQLPVSQEYQRREIENIVEACHAIEREVFAGEGFEITPARLASLNRQVLDGLEFEEGVVPGEHRTGDVVVGNVYRGAPAGDCEFLVAQMCDWLNGSDFAPVEDRRESFLRVFLRAAVAHVYIAWIHPFGDGNGRTARLVEFGILIAAGIPSVSAHLLSNHYNLTRTAYYRQLDRASRSGGDLSSFFS
jgi:Fic family protein